MPRGSSGSVFDRIRVQGRKVLDVIEAEIAERQAQLDALREQANLWLTAMGARAPKRRGRPPGSGKKSAARTAPKATRRGAARKPRKAKRTSPAVDWEKVLGKLPRSFTLDDVARATPALKAHHQARVIAVARWTRSGAITKVGDGKYKKAGRKAA